MQFKVTYHDKRKIDQIYTPSQLAFFEEQKSQTPNTSLFDITLLDDNFPITQFIQVKNQLAWSNWFGLKVLKERRVQFTKYSNIFVEQWRSKDFHILYECLLHNNIPFFSVMVKYLKFLESKKNKMDSFIALNMNNVHPVFGTYTFEDFLFSTYNRSPLREQFAHITRMIYTNVPYYESLFFF